MIGSADMTNRRALEPTMSMALFKSPEYAQQVFTWLDKHGNTPVLRENFKHLVSICTVKPVKVPSVQPLQSKSADTSVLDTSTPHAQEVGQKLKHQSSMRFLPAAPARPASAASARRRHAVGHRPSTASAGLSRGSSSYESAHSSSQPVVTASIFLPVSKQAVVKQAELARPPSRARPPLPSSDTFLSKKPAKAAALESKAGCADSHGLLGPAERGTGPAVLLPVQSAGPSKVAGDQPMEFAQYCSSRAATDASSDEAAATKAGAGYNGVHSTAQLFSPAADLLPDASVSGCCMLTTAEPNAAEQQQDQPCSAQAGRQPSKHAAIQKQNSRPSTAGTKQGRTSPFDRRLALLHKGLPTHVPVADPSRPPSRARRLSTQPSLLPLPSGLSQSACMLPRISSADAANAAAAEVPLQAASSSFEQAAGVSCSQDHSTGTCGGSLLRKASSTQPAIEAPAAAVQGADLHDKGTVLTLSKPSSPTSVLPSAGLGDTTYNSFHGLADAYPELYKQAAAAGRAQKSNSRALQSVVGETLKGNPDLWKQQLKSAYTVCNDRLKQDAGWGSMDGVWDGSFLEWVGRSQLYSADLLSPDATKDLEQWMQCAAPADKRHMMALLRDLHATVTPTGPRWQSVSHSTHTRQVPFGDGKEVDREVQRGIRPATPASAAHKDQTALLADDKRPMGQTQPEVAALHEPAAPQVQSVSRPRGINVNVAASKGTFRSSISLSQGAPATVKSTYGDTHGASMPQLMAAVQTVAHQHAEAQKPVQVTCPYGSLDPLMDRAHLAVFPVPAGLLQGTAELHTDAQRSGLDETRYGQSFCSNAFKGDAAAMLAAAQRENESSKAAGCRTTIPLGKKAVNCVPLYDTTYHDEFKGRTVDVSQQRASAELVRSLYHAPTATVGCLTRSH